MLRVTGLAVRLLQDAQMQAHRSGVWAASGIGCRGAESFRRGYRPNVSS